MRTCLFVLFSFLQLYAAAQVKKATAETVVQRATVFTSGAQVRRLSTVPLTQGRTEVVFSGLSNQLDPHSLQLKADANITLLSVQATKDFFGQRKVEQEEQSLLEQRANLQDKINLDRKRLDVYKNEEAMLVKNQAIGGTAGVKSAELKEALDLQRQRFTDVYEKQLELQKRILSQEQELERTKAQLGEISKKKDSVNFAVTALIESKETRAVKFQLLYNIKDAGWYPTYDVRVTEVNKPLEVLMNANVFQRSGETWKDVALQLSSGNPGDNATPSKLQPWMLGYYDPSTSWMRAQANQPGVVSGRVLNSRGEPLLGAMVTVKGSALATVTDGNGFFKLENFPLGSVALVSSVGYESKAVALRPGYFTVTLKEAENRLDEVVVMGYGTSGDASAEAPNAPAPRRKQEEIQTVSVATQYQPTATVYVIDEKYTLETDGKTATISIKQFTIEAQYQYYAAPKIDPSAFLTANIVNWQEYDLQSGEASLYFEGTSISKTYIDLATSGDTLSLALGKDNSIRIARKLVKEFSSKKFISSNRVETKQYQIIVRNSKKVPVLLTIEDQFPVSTNKEIDVQDTNAPEAQVNKETGVASWNFTLPPAQDKTLRISYQVKYPKEKRVVLD